MRILWIVTIHIILNLNKFRQVWTCSDMFENHMNCNNSDLENLKNLDNWVLWTFWELSCRFRSILSSDLVLNSFESCFLWPNNFYKGFWNLNSYKEWKKKQDSKELSPRPLENAPKMFNSKKLFKLLMLKGSLSF